MAVEHNTITDPNIHEPKGVATAAINKVYMADGAGSGSWQHHPGSCHGEIYVEAGAISVGPTGGTITTDADYRNIGPTWSLSAGSVEVSLNSDNKALLAAVAGHYMLTAFASFTSGAVPAGTDYAMKFRVNDAAVLSTRRLVAGKETAGADLVTLTGTGFVTLAAGDYIDLMLGSSTADTVTVRDAGLSLVLMHEV